MNKKTLIAEFGGTEAKMARQLGMSPQRVNLWGDTLNKQQQDGVVAAIIRKHVQVRPKGMSEYVWDCVCLDRS